MLDLIKGMFRPRESLPADPSLTKENVERMVEEPNHPPLSAPTITVKCIPVRVNREPDEKAAKPFLFKTVGVPHLHDFIVMSFGHFNKDTGLGEMRQHTYKVERILRKENGIELQVMEEPMLMRVPQ
jgi:hypothetical protein